MKKYSIIFFTTLVLLVLSACNAASQRNDPSSSADEPEAVSTSDQGIDACRVDTISYDSLDEFENALSENQIAAQSNTQTYADEIANLSEMDVYYVPNGIPRNTYWGESMLARQTLHFTITPWTRQTAGMRR